MKTSIYYLNDEQTYMNIRVMDSNYDPANAKGDRFVILKPAEGQLFELDIPEDHVIYVKKWKTMVLISSMSRDVALTPKDVVLPPRVSS